MSENYMMLEDFFTLTEMKDGLTSVARVEELISLMQKDKDVVVKNFHETVRQWYTVANTLTATKSNECLEQFVKLDGLYALDRWLQEAQKRSNDTGGHPVDQLIIALLGSLTKLPIEKERSVSSGIMTTIETLVQHKNSGVHKKAKILYNRWKGNDNDPAVNFSTTVEGSAVEDKHAVKSVGNESHHQDVSDTTLSQLIEKDGSCQEGLSIMEESTIKARLSDVSESKDVTNDASEKNKSVMESHQLESAEDSVIPFPGNDDVKEFAGESILKEGAGEDTVTTDGVLKSTEEAQFSEKIGKKESDMEVDFVIDAAIEITKDVEHKVMDGRELLCSSSEGGGVQLNTPDSVKGEQDQPMMEPQNEMPTGQNLPGGALPRKGEDHLDKIEDSLSDQDSCQVTEAGQEPDDQKLINKGDFVMHEEVHLGETDHSRIPDGQKALNVEGSNSKQKQALTIDLNFVGGSSAGTAILAENIPASSGLPSGSSLIEANARRVEMPKMDLNSADQIDTTDLPNRHFRPSSSMRLMGVDLDLKDCINQKNSYDPQVDHGKSSSTRRDIYIMGTRVTVDDSYFLQNEEISESMIANSQRAGGVGSYPVMTYAPPPPAMGHSGGPSIGPSIPISQVMYGANSNTPGGVGSYPVMTYAPPPPAVGRSGLGIGPSIPISQVMYGANSNPQGGVGSYPVMNYAAPPPAVGPSGLGIGPSMPISQVMYGPNSNPPRYTLFPFGSGPSGFNLVGPPNLDVNSGLTVSGDRREDAELKVLFPIQPDDERSTGQTSSAGMTMKRNEPYGGFDPYPFIRKPRSPHRDF